MAREGWAGATVVCIASGPSLTAADCAVIREAQAAGRCRVIVINSSFPMTPWADVLYAGDMEWWKHYAGRVKKGDWKPFAGERWTTSRSAALRFGLQHVNGWHGHGTGLSQVAGRINLGGNSGYAAVGLAYEFGAKRVVLIGYDMQRTGGKSHHHGDHPLPLRNGSLYATWIKRFGRLARDLGAARIECINATRQTALQCFPRASIEDALNGEVATCESASTGTIPATPTGEPTCATRSTSTANASAIA